MELKTTDIGEAMGTIPKYTEHTACCGKCGTNLLPNAFDRKHKPKHCRNCGEAVNWAYLKKAYDNLMKQIEEAEKTANELLRSRQIELGKGIWGKKHVIKIERNNASLVPCEAVTLDFLRTEIGCKWIESIPAPDGYIIVDEEYLLNNPPNRNILASRYAHAKLNGTAILVNVWDCDFIPFAADEAENILEKLKEYQ